MGEQNAGLVALIAADDDAVIPDLIHVDVAVLIGLLVGREGPQALDVGNGDGAAQVVLLHIVQEVHKALVVIGAQVMVHVVGAGTQTGKRLGAGAAVSAAADDLGQGAGGAGLLVGVGRGGQRGVVDADRLAVQGGLCGDQVHPVGMAVELIDLGKRVEAGRQRGERGEILDLLPQEPHVHGLAGADAGLELFF